MVARMIFGGWIISHRCSWITVYVFYCNAQSESHRLALERERVQAAKLEAEATLTKTKNDAKSFELTKMVEEAKILSMPLAGIDTSTKLWYMMIRDQIGKKLMSIQEPPVQEVVPPSI
jgi:hypothetical protein